MNGKTNRFVIRNRIVQLENISVQVPAIQEITRNEETRRTCGYTREPYIIRWRPRSRAEVRSRSQNFNEFQFRTDRSCWNTTAKLEDAELSDQLFVARATQFITANVCQSHILQKENHDRWLNYIILYSTMYYKNYILYIISTTKWIIVPTWTVSPSLTTIQLSNFIRRAPSLDPQPRTLCDPK